MAHKCSKAPKSHRSGKAPRGECGEPDEGSRRAVSAPGDGMLRVWDLAPEKVLACYTADAYIEPLGGRQAGDRGGWVRSGAHPEGRKLRTLDWPSVKGESNPSHERAVEVAPLRPGWTQCFVCAPCRSFRGKRL